MRILYLLLLFSCPAYAHTYYVSTNGKDHHNGLSPAQAWSYKRLQQALAAKGNPIIVPGDSILLQRGQRFFGSLVWNCSGREQQPIVMGSYGNGAKPVISGLVYLKEWQAAGKNRYSTRLDLPSNAALNVVQVAGKVYGMGRYPNENTTNKGYLTVEDAAADATSISSSNLEKSAINWTGATLVARLSHFVLDTSTILRQQGAVVTTRKFGKKPPKGFGFFLTNDPRTLDKHGEWFYERQSGNLILYLDAPPERYNIGAAVVDTLVNLGRQSFIVLQDIKFEGANDIAASLEACPNITITRCEFEACGNAAIAAANQRNINLTVTDNVIEQCGDLGIGARFVKSGLNIHRNTIRNIGTMEQHGSFNVMGRMAIYNAAGSDHVISYNTIDSIGTAGIRFSGSNIRVHHNLVQNFALVLHDCGGIYTGNASRSKLTNRKVYSNIVLNGVGATAGTNGTNQASGIYSDDASHNLEIFDNVIAHGGDAGIYLHNNWNVRVHNNLVFDYADVAAQIVYDDGKWDPPHGISFTGNTLVAKDPKAMLLKLLDHRDSTAFKSVVALRNYDNGTTGCTIDSNIYARPADERGNKIFVGWHIYQKGLQQLRQYTAPQFSKIFGFDAASKEAPAMMRKGSSTDPFLFVYNATSRASTVTLAKDYIGMDGRKYKTGKINLQPFTGMVLLQQ